VKIVKKEIIKVSFNMKNIFSTLRLLELLHIDSFVPSRITSLGVNYYAIVIVDDFLRYTRKFVLSYKK